MGNGIGIVGRWLISTHKCDMSIDESKVYLFLAAIVSSHNFLLWQRLWPEWLYSEQLTARRTIKTFNLEGAFLRYARIVDLLACKPLLIAFPVQVFWCVRMFFIFLNCKVKYLWGLDGTRSQVVYDQQRDLVTVSTRFYLGFFFFGGGYRHIEVSIWFYAVLPSFMCLFRLAGRRGAMKFAERFRVC